MKGCLFEHAGVANYKVHVENEVDAKVVKKQEICQQAPYFMVVPHCIIVQIELHDGEYFKLHGKRCHYTSNHVILCHWRNTPVPGKKTLPESCNQIETNNNCEI
mgnify:CR=1 FL=1